MNTVKIDHKGTELIAHRGLSGIEKENTAASFIAACNRSYYGCECDIHLTKDKKYVICHDSNLKRVGDHDVDVHDYKLEELYKFKLIDNVDNVRREYLQVISMKDYVDICKKYSKKCIIEYKDEFTKDQVSEILNIIKNVKYLDKCIFISFLKNPLVYTKQLNENIECQLLISEFKEDVYDFCRQFNIGLDANYHCLNKDIIKRYHDLHLHVNAWTVDDPAVAKKLIKDKIDFITTNILE